MCEYQPTMNVPGLRRVRPFLCVFRAAAAGALVLASACSGGGSHPIEASATAKPLGAAHFTLTIPKHIATSAKRRATYISASTEAVLFTVSPGALQSKINLTSSNCTPNPAGTANLCTLTVSAPIGSDTFAMVAYDKPFNTDGSQPAGTQALSAASNFTATVVEGTSNVTTALIAGGIPSSLSIAYSGTSSTTLTGGASSTTALTVTVYDADGNIIVAPGSYVNALGIATPVTITSSAATTGFGYAVTPAGSTTAGATGGTITLNEPDDSVALAYNGSAYVPATDTLSHTVPSNIGGSTTTQLGYGWHFTPPFTPALLLAPPSSISSTLGYKGIVIADRTSTLGFVGDAMTMCTVPLVQPANPNAPGATSRIGGLTFNAGETDTNVYLWVEDMSQPSGTSLDQIAFSSIISESCTPSNASTGSLSGATPQGVAAAGNDLYAVDTVSGTGAIEYFTLPGVTPGTYGVLDSGLGIGPEAVGVSPSGTTGYIQYGDKKKIESLPFGATSGTSQALAGMTDGYPGGLTIDASGNAYANDTTSATYGSNGGIDVFSPSFTKTNQIQLASVLSQSGPAGALENLAVGPYGSSSALYAVTAAGIEVFAFPLAATVAAPTTTITVPETPVSIVTCQDGREWVLLSDGTIDALPPN